MRTSRPDLPAALAVVVAVLAVSAGIAALALALAQGVVPLGGSSYRTEFISPWWWLAFLLVPVPAVAARTRAATAAAATAALVVPQFAAAAVVVGRYRSSGWSDGLEVFAFGHPLLLTLVTAILVALVRRRA
ncbi:hypothetical protein GCU54_12610 [Geodermatophilus normandii]|uniref:Uncharacterized protein n=1 Tax=Geodermatophilus normandii TaxID=1137989 RepID=A0A6P0GHW1_9ACTN|nr:hypothetical protein [Geodermatophilus normandii]